MKRVLCTPEPVGQQLLFMSCTKPPKYTTSTFSPPKYTISSLQLKNNSFSFLAVRDDTPLSIVNAKLCARQLLCCAAWCKCTLHTRIR